MPIPSAGSAAWLSSIWRPEALRPLDTPFTEFGSVRAAGDRVVFRAGAPGHPASIVVLDLGSGRTTILKKSTDLLDRPEPRIADYLTKVESVEFPTTDGDTAFGLFYPPANPEYAPPAGERPPLLVKCHGGPTSAASSALNLGIQYWTSRGIAVLDVNYGGSTGFGRAYRDRLHLTWGVVDVDDCVNGASFLAERGLVDGKRCVISGGSAGGYTTLAALTFRDFFQGGASYYGVSDAAALARDTHKFESRYLDWLIGPYPQRRRCYRERSPLFPRGAAVEAGDLLPGRRGRHRAAEPGRSHGRGAPAQGQSGRLFPVCRRATRLSQGRQHPALPGCRALFLRDRRVRDRADVLEPAARACVSSANAANILCGVSGVSLSSTPRPCRASFTALRMAAGGGMAPPSPTPLIPYSVLGDGVSMWWTAMRGMSVAPGSM